MASPRPSTSLVPARWYSDPDVLAVERERVFRPAWWYVGAAAEVNEPGAYLAGMAGDVPVLAVRGDDGVLRGFANVCRHRARQVAEGSGRATSFSCPFHGWRYGQDGCLLEVPGGDAEAVREISEGLAPIRLGVCGPLLFATASADAPPLEQALRGIFDFFAAVGPSAEAMVPTVSTSTGVMEANWKLVMESSLECYHCSDVHPAFDALVDTEPEGIEVRQTDSTWTYCQPIRVDWQTRPTPGERYGPRDDEPQRKFEVHAAWPNLLIAVSPGPANFTVITMLPDAVDRTRFLVTRYAPEDADPERLAALRRWVSPAFDEDRVHIESAQVGMASGTISAAISVPAIEPLVDAFQRRLRAELDPHIAVTPDGPPRHSNRHDQTVKQEDPR